MEGNPVVKVVDPRLNLVSHEKIATVAVEGSSAAAVYVIPRQEPADNPVADIVSMQSTFPINVQDGMIVGRRVELYQRYRVRITRTAAAKGDRIFVANAVAPRAFVNHSIMGTLTANINNLSYSWQPAKFGAQLMQINGTQLQKYSSGSPYIFDCSTEWDTLFASNRNVLANINSSSTGDYYRGAYVSVIANPDAGAPGDVTCELEFESTEPLMCPPFQWTGPGDATAGLAYIRTAQVVYQLAPNYKRAICLSADNMPVTDATKVKVYIVESSLRVTMFTPQPTIPIPPEVYYSVPLQNVVENQVGAAIEPSLTDNAVPIKVHDFTSNVIACSGMPSLVAAWIAPTAGLSATPYYVPDWTCGIAGASVNLGSTVSAFSTYSSAQLYQLALNHKWCRSFMEYRGYVQDNIQVAGGGATVAKGLTGTSGGILLFNPTDVGITGLVSGGSSGAYNLSITLRYINQASTAQNLTMYVVCFYENSWKLASTGMCESAQPVIDAARLLDAKDVTNDDIATNGGEEMVGAGWLDAAKSALRVGKKYARYAKEGLNALDKAGVLSGEGSRSGAGRHVGGAVISKSKLAKALKHH